MRKRGSLVGAALLLGGLAATSPASAQVVVPVPLGQQQNLVADAYLGVMRHRVAGIVGCKQADRGAGAAGSVSRGLGARCCDAAQQLWEEAWTHSAAAPTAQLQSSGTHIAGCATAAAPPPQLACSAAACLGARHLSSLCPSWLQAPPAQVLNSQVKVSWPLLVWRSTSWLPLVCRKGTWERRGCVMRAQASQRLQGRGGRVGQHVHGQWRGGLFCDAGRQRSTAGAPCRHMWPSTTAPGGWFCSA